MKFTTDEVSEIIGTHFWILTAVCKFLGISKAKGKYELNEKHLDYLKEIHGHFKLPVHKT